MQSARDTKNSKRLSFSLPKLKKGQGEWEKFQFQMKFTGRYKAT